MKVAWGIYDILERTLPEKLDNLANINKNNELYFIPFSKSGKIILLSSHIGKG